MEKTSQVYKKLYHYTTLDGAYGILESQMLWATHYKFLNDKSEIILFKEKLSESLRPYIYAEYKKLEQRSKKDAQIIVEYGGIDAVVEKDIRGLVESNYGALGDEIYITSFCGEHEESYLNDNGILSQWRAYGPDGGIMLVFDTLELEKMLNSEGERFSYGAGVIADLIYSDDEEKLKRELTEPLKDIAEFAHKIFLHVVNGKEEAPEAGNAMNSFVQCIGRYKHRGFKEEKEVRLISLPTVHTANFLEIAKKSGDKLVPEKPRKYRNVNGEKIPYIELFGFPNQNLPIERIVVGPHKQKEQRAAGLRSFLRNTEITISISDIPYVG